MILLTGATGTVGSALLRRLTADGQPVRALVRDPRRLGDQRVRVQIALGDLADPPSFRNALRGVDTVVHMAASIRDQPRASIEELNALATLRLVRAAERAGAQRFLFFSAMSASHHSRTRFFRAKALAQEAVEASPTRDHDLRALDRLHPRRPLADAARPALAPSRRAGVRLRAGGLRADLGGGRGGRGHGRTLKRCVRSYDLAGPEILSYDDIVRTTLRASGRRRRLLHVPLPLVRASLKALRRVAGPKVFATWEEAELMEEPMVSERGTADIEKLGVTPLPMPAVLGV